MTNFQRLALSAVMLVIVGISIGANAHRLPNYWPASPVPQVVQQVKTDSAARVVLKAPDKAKVGQLVILDVSESTAASFKWELRTKSTNFLVIENGKRAVFTAEVGGEYTFVIAAAKGDTVDVVIHTVKVAGAPATPGDDLPAKVASWSEPVTSPTKRDDALKLAQSFSSLAAVIKPEMTPEDIIEATKSSNRDALGDNLKHWAPFLDGLGSEMTKLSSAGQLNDAEAHKRVWKSIADSLGAYAQTL
jgi:predicted secreted protein